MSKEKGCGPEFRINSYAKQPSFQGHGIFEVACLRDKVSIEH